MWIKRSEFENLLGKYRSAVAEEQGKVEALRKMLDTCEEQVEEYRQMLSEWKAQYGG